MKLFQLNTGHYSSIIGLVFSVIALVLYLPACSLGKSSVRRP